MDPSIMKIFEDDEDEHIHSGADVEAFTAALNRDISGASTSQPIVSDGRVSSHGSNPVPSQLFGQWQTTNQEENTTHQQQEQQEQQQLQQTQEQNPSEMEQLQRGPGTNNRNQQSPGLGECDKLVLQQNQQNLFQFAEKSQVPLPEQNSVPCLERDRFQQCENQNQYPQVQQLSNQQTSGEVQANNQYLQMQQLSNQQTSGEVQANNQYLQMQQLSNQQTSGEVQANNQMKQPKPGTIPFAMLIPVILPHLDKDRAMQLQAVFNKLRRNEIDKADFLRVTRGIVGDQMLKQAAQQLHHTRQAQSQAMRNSQAAQHQYQFQSQASLQHANLPSHSSQLFESQQFSQIHSLTSNQHQKSHKSPECQSQAPTSTVQMHAGASENSTQKARQTENQHDGQGMQGSQISSSGANRVNQEGDLSVIPLQSVNQQQHLQLPQSTFSMFGRPVSNYHTQQYSMPTVSSSLKAQTQDSQSRQGPYSQGIVPSQLGSNQPVGLKSVPKYELQSARSEPKRLQGGSLPPMANHSAWQSPLVNEQKPSGLPSMGYVKQEVIDQTASQQHKTQLSAPQSSSSFNVLNVDHGKPAALGPAKDESIEKQSARVSFAPPTNMLSGSQVSGSTSAHLDHAIQMRPQIPSAPTPVGMNNNNMRTPPKKPSVGQKKPLDALGTSPSQLPSKKQKVSGVYLDQSIEQLNDVTAVSGVNLREEEEQLLSGLKDESRASEATRRVVQEEEERLILQKGPLQKKIAEITSKCGVKGVSNDVERCLSMCVEERMRGLITNLIRLSKQRVDIEKPRHRIFITADVRRQILVMNRKAKEDWDKKQAEEAEKLRKQNEAEGSTGVETDKEESRVKTLKANKEEDDKMRTTAANVAARAAVGGDDMLSKWQLMAEQARQKREGGLDGASGVLANKDASRKPLTTSGKAGSENQEPENKNSSAATSGAIRNFARNTIVMPQTKISHSISIKDVIAALEREPQMSKSTLIFRLHERETAAEKTDLLE